MPRKGKQKPQKNRQLDFTLPDGGRHLLDQLVALKVVGDSYSGVIAFLVETQRLNAIGCNNVSIRID